MKSLPAFSFVSIKKKKSSQESSGLLAGSSVLHVAVTSIGDGATLPAGGQAHEYVEPTRALLPERL